VYSSGLSTHPGGLPVLTVQILDVWCPILTDWGLSDRKLSNQLKSKGLRPKVMSFSHSLSGMTVLNADAVINKHHSNIYVLVL